MVPHRALVNLLCAMRDQLGVAARDVMLAATSLSFDIAALELFLPLLVGARVAIAPRDVAKHGRRLAALIEDSGATVMQATPTTWRMLLEAGWRGSPRSAPPLRRRGAPARRSRANCSAPAGA